MRQESTICEYKLSVVGMISAHPIGLSYNMALCPYSGSFGREGVIGVDSYGSHGTLIPLLHDRVGSTSTFTLRVSTDYTPLRFRLRVLRMSLVLIAFHQVTHSYSAAMRLRFTFYCNKLCIASSSGSTTLEARRQVKSFQKKLLISDW